MSRGYHLYEYALARRLAKVLTTNLFDEYGYVQHTTVSAEGHRFGSADCYAMEPHVEYDDQVDCPLIVQPTVTGLGGTPAAYRAGSDIWLLHMRERMYAQPHRVLEWVFCCSSRQNRWKLIRRGTMAHRIREYERLAAFL